MSEIVALHGAVGSPEDWLLVEQTLGVPLTKPCLWEGPHLPAMDTWAADLNRRHPGGGILLGYSLGARLALHALTQPAAPWRAAVLLSPHPGLQNEADRRDRLAADFRWAHLARTATWHEFLEAWNVQPVLAGGSVSATQQALESRRDRIAESFEGWSLGKQRDFRPQFTDIRIPVVWAAGVLDEKFRRLAEECCGFLPNCHLKILGGAGHRLHLEAPQQVAEIVRSVL